MTRTLTRRPTPGPDRERPEPVPPPPHGTVLAAVKGPMAPRPLTATLAGHLTLAGTVRALRALAPADDAARRVLQQLERETSGPHDYLAVGPEGELTRVDPDKTQLEDIAVPREIRTASGPTTTLVAAFEIQGYARVGLA